MRIEYDLRKSREEQSVRMQNIYISLTALSKLILVMSMYLHKLFEQSRDREIRKKQTFHFNIHFYSNFSFALWTWNDVWNLTPTYGNFKRIPRIHVDSIWYSILKGMESVEPSLPCFSELFLSSLIFDFCLRRFFCVSCVCWKQKTSTVQFYWIGNIPKMTTFF